jgi:hypothetical protein
MHLHRLLYLLIPRLDRRDPILSRREVQTEGARLVCDHIDGWACLSRKMHLRARQQSARFIQNHAFNVDQSRLAVRMR